MLKLFNTMTGKKEEFKPIEEGKVKMYVCGITVYDFCHIGHARAMISFDVITRFLRHIGYDLTFVRNITDVDDKIIKRAEENGEKPSELTERMIAAMHEDELALGNKLPDQEPKATEFMQQIIDMIQVLVDKGFAYQGESGDVFYRASKFSEYGKLNNRKLEDMLAGARIEVEASKEHPADFVLWKIKVKPRLTKTKLQKVLNKLVGLIHGLFVTFLSPVQAYFRCAYFYCHKDTMMFFQYRNSAL